MILGGMLVLTTISSRFNKAYETKTEFFITVGGTFLSLFVIYFLGDKFPANIFAVGVFSLFIGIGLISLINDGFDNFINTIKSNYLIGIVLFMCVLILSLNEVIADRIGIKKRLYLIPILSKTKTWKEIKCYAHVK